MQMVNEHALYSQGKAGHKGPRKSIHSGARQLLIKSNCVQNQFVCLRTQNLNPIAIGINGQKFKCLNIAQMLKHSSNLQALPECSSVLDSKLNLMQGSSMSFTSFTQVVLCSRREALNLINKNVCRRS